MGKSYFFFGLVKTHPEDEKRVSRTDGSMVVGGSKQRHQKVVDLVGTLEDEFKKDPPQTPGEERMIMLDVMKKFR